MQAGNADLCSYFLLRDLSIAPHGRVGIIATNTIAQGDTREVGLDQAVDMGWAVYRAEKSQRWPGTASLEVSLLWAGHPGERRARILDGQSSGGHNTITRSTSRGFAVIRTGSPRTQASPSRARSSWALGFILDTG